MSLFSFRLSDSFVAEYMDKTPPFGFRDAAGNSLGELVFLRSYSRLKDDGTKEKWYEACERIINGMYSIQKDWCQSNRLEWNGAKAQKSAREAYDTLFNLKWTPPGRGLAQMGSEVVMRDRNAASLLNCAFISTADMSRHNPGEVFAWTVEASMNGIGVGFDTLGTKNGFTVRKPSGSEEVFVVPDTREGWGEAVRLLVNSFLLPGDQPDYSFDYSEVRPYGAPIKTFGGTASGPEPLAEGLERIRTVLSNSDGQPLSSKNITDIMNIIGVFVVAGNTRRSAMIALGESDDDVFPTLKDVEAHPEREWRWMSNNSVKVGVGEDVSSLVQQTVTNGEPGFLYLDVARDYGRLIDPPNYKDSRVAGVNPCSEQFLESWEMCCLVEAHLNNIADGRDFKKALKAAYLYAKTVTLMTTPWPKTNAVMLRNRRIGTSQTSIVSFVEKHGIEQWRGLSNEGYKYVQDLDTRYSEWLGVRSSIKTTTVKPSGSVSLLSGATPGVHWPAGAGTYMRTVRYAAENPVVALLDSAGYRIEDDITDKSGRTKVVYFPMKMELKRSEKDVSIFEKIHLAAEAQKYWSDNGVSVTVTFDAETEKDAVETVINMYSGQLKAVSFLPMDTTTVYPQAPYIPITEDEYWDAFEKLSPVDMSVLYANGAEAEVEQFCTTDKCEVK